LGWNFFKRIAFFPGLLARKTDLPEIWGAFAPSAPPPRTPMCVLICFKQVYSKFCYLWTQVIIFRKLLELFLYVWLTDNSNKQRVSIICDNGWLLLMHVLEHVYCEHNLPILFCSFLLFGMHKQILVTRFRTMPGNYMSRRYFLPSVRIGFMKEHIWVSAYKRLFVIRIFKVLCISSSSSYFAIYFAL
jgi:hypothetical protein